MPDYTVTYPMLYGFVHTGSDVDLTRMITFEDAVVFNDSTNYLAVGVNFHSKMSSCELSNEKEFYSVKLQLVTFTVQLLFSFLWFEVPKAHIEVEVFSSEARPTRLHLA